MDIDLQLGWQLTLNDKRHTVEPVLFQLLTAIKQAGSLKKATEDCKVSYRYAWGLLNKWQTVLGQALVILEPGRGAHLSSLGDKLIHADLQLNARFSPQLDNFATQFKREFQSLLSQSDKTAFKLFASHGLAVGALRDLINQQSDFKIDLHFQGSIESLRALDQSNCDIAGFHIPIGPIAKPLLPHYLDILHPDTYDLVYLIKRQQGLMFRQDTSDTISSLNDLIRTKLRFVNRQSGSGTRLLFDQLLVSNNIEAEQIAGYQHEEFTHLAVAALVASQAADVAFGIEPMAEKFGLSFMPLVWEHYCLAVPKQISRDKRIMQMKALLQSQDYRQYLSASPGYDATRSGETVSFDDIFSTQ